MRRVRTMAEASDSASAHSAQRQIPHCPVTPPASSEQPSHIAPPPPAEATDVGAHVPTQASVDGALQAWASGVRAEVLVVEATAMLSSISIEAPGLGAFMLEMFGGVVHDRELETGEAL